jgi:putative transposase
MLRAYKYRLLPTQDQKIWFDGLFRACRFIYNLGLEVKSTAWRSAHKNVSSYDLMKQITDLKNNDCQWLKSYPSQSLESEMSNLDASYNNFFKGGGYPNFKKRFGRQSATFRRDSVVGESKIRLSKIGFVDFIEHRKLPEGQIRTVVVSKEQTGKYFVSILLQDGKELPGKSDINIDTSVGIDVGLKTFATLSDGQTFDNPKYLNEQLKRLRVEQRKLARRFKKGVKEQSKGYQKQKLVVALLHEKIANKRKDFLHKTSSEIVDKHDTVCVETLNVSGMQQNRKLSKAISDVGWYEFIRLIEYKTQWNGKNIVKIGRFQPSSKMCSICGTPKDDLQLSDREWDCDNCGAHHKRDLNAAINIKNFGLKAEPSPVNVGQKVERIGCEPCRLTPSVSTKAVTTLKNILNEQGKGPIVVANTIGAFDDTLNDSAAEQI